MPNGNGMNGTWKTIAILALGGGLGAGTGSITASFADTKAIREVVASSPEIATVKANQAAIKEDLEQIRVDQREMRVDQREISRKVDRVLFVLERENR